MIDSRANSSYKKTSIGKIPEDWEVVKLKDVCTKITDGTHKTPKYLDKGIPFISTQNITPFKEDFDFSQYRKYISEEEHNELKKRCNPERDDILISKCGTIGRTKLIDVDYEFSIFVGLALLKLKKVINGNYLEQLLNTEIYKKIMEISSPGATRKTLTIRAIERLKIPFPSLPEQQKIAEILGTVDEAIEKVDKAIERTERLKKGLMQKLLTKGIPASRQYVVGSRQGKEDGRRYVVGGRQGKEKREFKDSEIGRIPKEWEVFKLKELVDVKGGKRLPKGDSLVDFETNYPYIRIVDFKNGSVDVSDVKYLLPETYRKIKKYTISSKDVYISIAGTIGLAGLIPPELDGANLTENAAKLNNLKKVMKEYLVIVLNSHILQNQINRFTGKATQPKLALFRIEKLKVLVPSEKEQQEIVEILSTVDKKIDMEKKRKEKLERIKKGLMQDLLTGRKRVKI